MPDGSNYGSDSTAALLAERGKTHGDFTDHARITSRLKDVVLDELHERTMRGQPLLTMEQRESLDMILHKIGRIIAGNAGFQVHWDDIAGYAKLVSERCPQNVTNVSVAPARILPRREARPIGVGWQEPAASKTSQIHADPGDEA
jgi:hypothetical protein